MKKPSRPALGKRQDPGKANCQLWHFKKRFKERMGIVLTDELYNHLLHTILNDRVVSDFSYKKIEDQSNRLAVYEIKIGSKTVDIVLDKFRKSLITVLFKEEVKNIYHYIDVFKNKVNIKAEHGHIWKLNEITNELTGPCETFEYKNGLWTMQSTGKIFSYEHGELIEQIY